MEPFPKVGSVTDDGHIEKVVVIGAGPSGVAAAKYLLAEKSFTEIVIFEQRLIVGGLWNATPREIDEGGFAVPQTRPSVTAGNPIWTPSWEGVGERFRFSSPMYDDLETNIPHTLMRYSDQEFPEGTPLFPPREEVLKYLERYSSDVIHLVKFGMQVLNVRDSKKTGEKGGWYVTTRNLISSQESTSRFDAVIVASGHHDDYYIPDIPGIKEWNITYPDSILHSKFYRRPDTYEGKKVLIVGNSASGIDIASQIAPCCKSPLIISSRSPTPADFPKPSSPITELPEIERFTTSDHSIHFSDGHIEKDIETIIFCTGYMYSFPFLSKPLPPLITDGSRARNLYHQVFYWPNPTLSFLSLPYRVHPLPIAQSQSAVIARFLAGRLTIPPQAAMREWEDSLISKKGDGRKYHLFGFPYDAEYINLLHDWAMSAPRKKGLENNGNGKTPPYWGDREKWLREKISAVKSRYRALGAERKTILHVEQLGLYFEEVAEEAQAKER